MITGFSHVSIVVPSVEIAGEFLQRTYGLILGEIRTNEEQGVRLAYVNVGNAHIELLEPNRPDSPIAKFLERHPQGGIHHLCLKVDSVDESISALAASGARVLGEGRPQVNVHGDRIAFVHPRDFLGALLELEEHR